MSMSREGSLLGGKQNEGVAFDVLKIYEAENETHLKHHHQETTKHSWTLRLHEGNE